MSEPIKRVRLTACSTPRARGQAAVGALLSAAALTFQSRLACIASGMGVAIGVKALTAACAGSADRPSAASPARRAVVGLASLGGCQRLGRGEELLNRLSGGGGALSDRVERRRRRSEDRLKRLVERGEMTCGADERRKMVALRHVVGLFRQAGPAAKTNAKSQAEPRRRVMKNASLMFRPARMLRSFAGAFIDVAQCSDRYAGP